MRNDTGATVDVSNSVVTVPLRKRSIRTLLAHPSAAGTCCHQQTVPHKQKHIVRKLILLYQHTANETDGAQRPEATQNSG